MCGSFAKEEEPTIRGPGVRTFGRDATAKRRDVDTGVTARTLLARPCRPDAGRVSTLPRPVRSKQDSHSPERTACIGVALVGRTEDIDQSTLRDLRCRGDELAD
jgi:hypothetical protein